MMLYIPCQMTNEWLCSKHPVRGPSLLERLQIIPKETQTGTIWIYKPYISWTQTFRILFELKNNLSKQSIQTSVRFLLMSQLPPVYSIGHDLDENVRPFSAFHPWKCFFSQHVPFCESAAQAVRASSFPCESRSRLALLPLSYAQHC